jgi:hypothetical protein
MYLRRWVLSQSDCPYVSPRKIDQHLSRTSNYRIYPPPNLHDAIESSSPGSSLLLLGRQRFRNNDVAQTQMQKQKIARPHHSRDAHVAIRRRMYCASSVLSSPSEGLRMTTCIHCGNNTSLGLKSLPASPTSKPNTTFDRINILPWHSLSCQQEQRPPGLRSIPRKATSPLRPSDSSKRIAASHLQKFLTML